MNTASVIVEGTLQADGVTLRLEKKLAIPPGRVTIAVQAASIRGGPTMLETLDRIHAEQKKRGHKPMTDEEMAAQIAHLRSEDDEAESRWQEIRSQTKPPNTDRS